MMEPDLYHLPFEIECHKKPDHFEFCRVFFKPASPFHRHLFFGMDGRHFSTYKQFMKHNAGMVVNRFDKLTIHIANMRTGKHTALAIDLEPYWPADLGPGEVKASLAEIDMTGAIRELM